VTAVRWRQINELFHRALEREPDAREAFIDRAAGGDAELAREVRSLLTSHERAGGFLDDPAWGVGADLLMDDHDSSLVGRRIGPYRVVDEIGRGGMGVVYAAEDTRLGRTVALKALAPEFTRDPTRRERLSREARAAAPLSHPAIATIYALEEIDGALYLSSELVRGRTLRDELRDGPLPPERLIDTLIDIATALDAAHAQHVVHRDLKPENVMRRTDGQIKVLDFGLARFGPVGNGRSVTRLTEAGIALGTPGYMAPEQFSGGTTDARADIFAFGIIAWELATGEHPFGPDTGTLLARMTEFIEGRATPVSRPLPIAGLQAVVRRCLRRSLDERYPSAAALLEDLRALKHPGVAAARSPGETPARFWWWQFHQASMAVLNGLTPIPAWLVRQWADRPFGSWVFYTVLVLATVSVTLRCNLLFAARVYPESLPSHRARLFPAIIAAEALLGLVLLICAALVAGPHDAIAAVLVSVAIIVIASLVIIEPATTGAAGM
jgi:predicted Ser/Thr protein kinase